MAIKDILDRADKEKRKYDHVGWKAICKKCGLHHNVFADKIKLLFGSEEVDIRRRDIKCDSSECGGFLKIWGKIPTERAIHLHDILRRK